MSHPAFFSGDAQIKRRLRHLIVCPQDSISTEHTNSQNKASALAPALDSALSATTDSTALACLFSWFDSLQFCAEGTSLRVLLPHSFFLGWMETAGTKKILEEAIYAMLGQHCSIVWESAPAFIPLQSSTVPSSIVPSSIVPSSTAGNLPINLPGNSPAASPFVHGIPSPYEKAKEKEEKTGHFLDQLQNKETAPAEKKDEPGRGFDQFLVGPKNQSALNILRKSAEQNTLYNPIFIKGASGTGKTHLLRAMATALRRRFALQTDIFSAQKLPKGMEDISRHDVFYLSAADFTPLFRQPNADDIRRAFRAAKALCLDDIQFLAGDASAQNELTSLLDYLIEHGTPVVISCTTSIAASATRAALTGNFRKEEHAAHSPSSAFSGASDAPPFEGALTRRELSPPLLARLASGMTLELAEPDLDIRIRYAQAQLKEQDLRTGKDIPLLLARRCPDLRHLRGAILRITAFRQHTGQLPDEADLDTILNATGNPRALSPEAVLAMVANHCGYSPRDLRGRKRDPKLVQARQIAMYLCRELFGESYPSLGKIFGGKDHSTVMHSVKKIREIQVTNKDVHTMVTELTQRCRSCLFQDYS